MPRPIKNPGLRRLVDRLSRKYNEPVAVGDLACMAKCSRVAIYLYTSGPAPRWPEMEARLAAALHVTVRTLRRNVWPARARRAVPETNKKKGEHHDRSSKTNG